MTMVKCVVQGCPNKSYPKAICGSRPHKRFFSFPKDPARVKVWLAALRETDKVPSDDHRICEDHFLKDHITPRGVSEDAIPIMPPYLDGPLAMAAGSGSDEQGDLSDAADLQDEDAGDRDGGHLWETEAPDVNVVNESGVSGTQTWSVEKEGPAVSKDEAKFCAPRYRCDVSLSRLTKRFMELLRSAPNGIVDLNDAARVLGARKRRVYDVTNVLGGIQLIKKRSTSQIQWVGSVPCSELDWKEKLREELLDLSAVEEALDELIRDCAQQLFTLTDHEENANSAYVTHEDICRIEAFQEQVVIAIKAPEETKLEVPTPREDGIQMHLKGSRGPISVLMCETESQGSEKAAGGSFSTLEDSKIHTAPLNRGKPGLPPSTSNPGPEG
ncbi:transcription factor E2F6 [Megalops cyprinoides]|uniref:transcription factor E2F6 n=1 Tax=Megalops cyprinoides TaxID=118141 RepID=UPI001863D201|nr:transcription factor E2F6 [Megalops cyprinoides]